MVDFDHKIQVPQRPAHLVPRPRLTELLNTIVERRLITLSAPAGYGKTSLLIDFANTETPLPLCWYSLDRFDQDPWVFVSYLAAAIARRFPNTTAQTAELLAGQGRMPFSSAAAALVHDIYAVGQQFAVILDDWHMVDHVTDISDLVAHILLRCPNCHFILASRIYPSLPDIMLLAARRQMSGLDEEQLRFTPTEVSAVLGIEYQTAIPDEQITNLVEQTNGWITGILLTYQAATTPGPSLVPAGKRAERQVYRFLTEQVFDHQPPEIRSFLLDSALLDELTPERCDTILGRTDSALLLEMLLQQHIFISEIRPGVLRYHPLFHEFLQEHYRKTDPQRHRQMQIRVADAYAAQEQWTLAFEYYTLAGDLQSAQRIVAAGGEKLYTMGRLETLERWFAALPLDGLHAPLLCIKARVLIDRGKYSEAQVLADLAETRMQPGEEPGVLLIQSLLARQTGRYEHAIDVAQKVLNTTPDLAEQAAALRTMAICHRLTGQSASAIEEFSAALKIERQRGDLYNVASLQHDLGICHEDLGLLHDAETYYNQADAYWSTMGNTGRRALSLNSKGVVQHLTGRYQEAYASLKQALTAAQSAALPDFQALILASLGDLYSDLQLWEQSSRAYEEARQLDRSAFVGDYLDLAVIRQMVRQRQYAAATRALERLPVATASRHESALILLRVHIAIETGSYTPASQDIQRAMTILERSNALLDLARAYLLQARVMARMAPADSAALLKPLEQAAQLADQLGHDAFLVAESLHAPGVLRRALSAGWTRAADWLQRHQDLLLAARMISQDDQRPVLVVHTLGTDQIIVNGAPLTIGWLKAREVFYYLLAHPEGCTPEVLREAIWPDLNEGSKGALKTAIYQLRTALPPDLIELQRRQFYRINPEVVHIDYDFERFRRIVDTQADNLDKLLEALDLYRGPYLPWSDNLWSSGLRSFIEQRYQQALRMAAERQEEQQDYADAMILYRRLLELDRLDEAAHAGIMRCQWAIGNRAAAIEQYNLIRRCLDEELGLEPGAHSPAYQVFKQILDAS